jgi:hypothetical protein
MYFLSGNQEAKKSSSNFFLNFFLLFRQKNRGKLFFVAASEFGAAHEAKKSSHSVFRLPSFFCSGKRKKQRKPLQRTM